MPDYPKGTQPFIKTHGGPRPGAGRPKGNPHEAFKVQSFTLSPATVEKLEAVARKQGRPKSHLVEEALKEFLK
jgi:hypothetical protein